MPRSVPARSLTDRFAWGKDTGRPAARNSSTQNVRAKAPRSSVCGSSSTTTTPSIGAATNRIAPSVVTGPRTRSIPTAAVRHLDEIPNLLLAARLSCPYGFATVLGMASFPCRFCGTQLRHRVVDLGMSPLCESFVPEDRVDAMEPFYPLHAWVCHNCFLVQINEYVAADHIFDEYAYFSSFSTSWLDHAREYVSMITELLELGPESFVVEL